MGHFSWGEVRVSTVWVERVLEACADSSQTKSGRSSAPARLAERGAAGRSAHSPPGQARSELEIGRGGGAWARRPSKMVPGPAPMVFDDLTVLSYLPVSEGASNMRAGGVTL